MMRELVDYLHARDQHYIVMVDPAIAYQDFPLGLQRGIDDNIFLLRENGSVWKGVVWPGVTAFPDWFSANISKYWNNEFSLFFNPEDGVDIDALWIDMNEPSNFPCNFPCDNPDAAAVGYPPEPPPVRSPPRALPGFSCDFQPEGTDCAKTEVRSLDIRDTTPKAYFDNLVLSSRQTEGEQKGLPGRDLLYPKYAIHNKAASSDSANAAEGGISNKTVNTDVIHQNGLTMYDTHNLYGSMMSIASHEAMLQRRPTLRPMIITRSTFAGAGTKVGHWLGDNLSTWDQYRLAIRSMMAFASVYQVPMVGADTCGFGDNTTEQLCSRWAALGAFAPFYRVHNSLDSISQELYRWEATAQSARKFIAIRYRLLDYMYTAMHVQTRDGTPMVSPLFYQYPQDKNTFGLDLQYLLGPGLLVAPVTEENSTSVDVYLPDDIFYDFHTHQRVVGAGKAITLENQTWTDLPLFLRGGVVVPLRAEAAMTTTELRTKPFEIIVAVGKDGKASGRLYVDDGVSVEQRKGTSDILFEYADGVLRVGGTFGYKGEEVRVSKVTFLGVGRGNGKGGNGGGKKGGNGGKKGGKRDAEGEDVVKVDVDRALTGAFTVEVNAA